MGTVVKVVAVVTVALGVLVLAVVPLTSFSAEVPGTRVPIVVPDPTGVVGRTATPTASPRGPTGGPGDPTGSRPAPSMRGTPSPKGGVPVVRPQPDDVDDEDDDEGRDEDDGDRQDDGDGDDDD